MATRGTGPERPRGTAITTVCQEYTSSVTLHLGKDPSGGDGHAGKPRVDYDHSGLPGA